MNPSEVPYPEDGTHALAEDCRRCPALCESRTRISWGNGPRDARVVVVGEAPAAGDPGADRWKGGNLTGAAYTSRASGRKVRALVADAGVGPAYYTNAVKCHPAGNRDPTEEERTNCRPWLREEVATVAPDAILPTGKHATASVFALLGRDLDGFLDTVLAPVDTEYGRVVPLLHPSYEEVWRSRLGHTRESYVAALAEAVSR
ncbi:uracil-DNA glycosylase [Halosegnis marinus]|uniref:Uracil-DNA glycosylase family protein n=1 Tax=Halosegnis marinus TaxID=3034023 RepID=A0ABD5ZPA9_9EURY|nr:uracil-DNA glycosylase [Halosegnis sp. DT85]